jgi:MFS family permease
MSLIEIAVIPISETKARVVPRMLPVRFRNLAILGCLLNIATKGTIAVYETMAVQYDIVLLHGSSMQTGLVVSISGALGAIVLFFFNQLTIRFSDFSLIVGGMTLMCLSCGILGFSNNFISAIFFISVAVMYTAAYPIGHTAILGMFSKIISDGPQGEMMGWFASSGSIARVVFPILAGVISNTFDDRLIFIVMSMVLVIAILFTIWFRLEMTEMIASGNT